MLMTLLMLIMSMALIMLVVDGVLTGYYLTFLCNLRISLWLPKPTTKQVHW